MMPHPPAPSPSPIGPWLFRRYRGDGEGEFSLKDAGQPARPLCRVTPLHRRHGVQHIRVRGRWRGAGGEACLLILLTFCALSTPQNVRAADVDLPTYAQRLTAARDALVQGRNEVGARRDAAVQRAQDALAGIDGVTVEGARYPVQHQSVLADLRRSPPDIERAIAELDALRVALSDEQGARPDPQARAKLDEVLRDRAFREAEPNAVQRQALRFRAWVGEQLGKLLRPFRRINPPQAPPGTPGAGPLTNFLALLGNPVTIVALAALIAAILLLRWRVLRRRRAPRRQGPDFRQRTASEWREYAASLPARGEYRAAVRALYLGTITELDERRLVRFDPALTDREYFREAQWQQPWLAEPLRPFVRLVEGIVYAGAPCGAAEYARARAAADAVLAQLGMPQAVAA
jgi:hypothetical protein